MKINTTFFYRLLVVSSLVTIALFVFMRKPSQVFTTKPTKVIEREIKTLKTEVKQAGEKVEIFKREVIDHRLMFDTVPLIQYLDSLVIYQDTQIVKLTQITEKQDTVIAVLRHDNKRLKRQRNLLAIVAGITTGIAILK